MTVCRMLSRFGNDRSGASAAEFALVVPIFLLFLLGTIDVGRFIWAVNENEKAAQIGTRWAVATDLICDGLTDYSFVTDHDPSVPQGTVVIEDYFPGADFAGGSATECNCPPGASCDYPLTVSADGIDAYRRLVNRMRRIQPRIGADDVSVRYSWSGLGYAGDPTGPDVAPTVTVALRSFEFRPLFLGGFYGIGIPGAQYSLTMEDGSGTFSN